MGDLSDRTTIVVGASRGLGHGIAAALAAAGAPVIAVSRTSGHHAQPAGGPGHISEQIADAADAGVPAGMLDRHDPHAVVIVGGATPHMRPLQQQTWETFSLNWDTDVRITFHWLREILLTPMRPGGRVIVVSSGAALNANGSPLSGGYAGAKATQRFITGYAQDEADRAQLDLTFTTVLPRFAPTTGVGESAVRAYAAQAGLSVEEFLRRQGPLLDPDIAGAAVVDLLGAKATDVASGYVLSGAGLNQLP